MNRHTALLAGAVLEAALPEQMLFLAGPEDVLGAVVRVENRFIWAIFVLAGLERSLETEARVLLDSVMSMSPSRILTSVLLRDLSD